MTRRARTSAPSSVSPQAQRAARVFAKYFQMLADRVDPALAHLDEQQLAGLLGAAVPQPSSQPQAAEHADWQDQLIEEQVPASASVLDLGCGNGELLARLIARKQVRGQGVELDADAVFECVAKGVPVLQSDVDGGLKGFNDQSFDYIVLEETLQTLHRPVEVLAEMLRVGRRSIVSFPNFGHWQIRFDLALRGRMPVTLRLPRPWYETPNIHLLTLQDFLDWASANRVRIVDARVLAEGSVRPMQPADNLHAEEALLVIEGAQA